MSITEKRENKPLSRPRRDECAGLKVEIGPDNRIRLVLDKSSKEGVKYSFINAAYLEQGELDYLTGQETMDFPEDDFDF